MENLYPVGLNGLLGHSLGSNIETDVGLIISIFKLKVYIYFFLNLSCTVVIPIHEFICFLLSKILNNLKKTTIKK